DTGSGRGSYTSRAPFTSKGQVTRVQPVRDRSTSANSDISPVSQNSQASHPEDNTLERELRKLRLEEARLKLRQQQLALDRESLDVERERQRLGIVTHGGSSSVYDRNPVREQDSRNLHEIVPPYKEGDVIN
ncbi:hypothetical protein NDU88_001255, partial [Pleurodeles waltl]